MTDPRAAHAEWYETKEERYFEGVRDDMLDCISGCTRSEIVVLEIGCGNGAMGEAALSRGLAARYYGVELFEDAASEASEKLTGVVCGDIESIDLPWLGVQFDYIIASEVLEHLVDPWKVVGRLSSMLRPGGRFLASSPNISHYSIAKNLAFGQFELRDSGPMDRTHLRWFTPATFARMFEEAGLEIEAIGPVAPPGAKARVLMSMLPRKMHGRLWRQINVRARKPDV